MSSSYKLLTMNYRAFMGQISTPINCRQSSGQHDLIRCRLHIFWRCRSGSVQYLPDASVHMETVLYADAVFHAIKKFRWNNRTYTEPGRFGALAWKGIRLLTYIETGCCLLDQVQPFISETVCFINILDTIEIIRYILTYIQSYVGH